VAEARQAESTMGSTAGTLLVRPSCVRLIVNSYTRLIKSASDSRAPRVGSALDADSDDVDADAGLDEANFTFDEDADEDFEAANFEAADFTVDEEDAFDREDKDKDRESPRGAATFWAEARVSAELAAFTGMTASGVRASARVVAGTETKL
jgi:hypothetical protein